MHTENDYRHHATIMREIADEAERDRDFKTANDLREIARHFDERATHIKRGSCC